MNIEIAKAYLQTAHMNRKVANYLIELIEQLQTEVDKPIAKRTIFNQKFYAGYYSAMTVIRVILNKEVNKNE